MKQRIRDLLRATPFLPFTIGMADGKTYKVDHPDFVLASTDTPQIVLEESDGTVHFLSVLLITSIEVSSPPAIA